MLMLAVAVAVVNLTVLAFRRADLLEDLQLYVRLMRSSAAVPTALAVGIGAPLSEELMFRGLLLPALALTRLGFAGAAIVATALWTALHWGYSITGLIEVAIFGLLLSWLFWRTGSLRVPLFCHALYNGLLLLGLCLLAPG
jgi:membrane protease YdiL (CAAX protease family)